MRRLNILIVIVPFLLLTVTVGQNNPAPFINQPLIPASAAPGSAAFTLTVNGTGFVNGSVVNWNGNALTTTFVNSSQLTATVSAADVSSPSTGTVSVVNPTPGGGRSNSVFLPVSSSTTSVSTTEADITVGPYAASMAAGDFNNDGKLDLAVLAQCGTQTCSPSGSSFVSILLGNGDGSFTSAPNATTANWATGMAVGDFNSDGNLDLAILSGEGTSSFPIQLSVFLGNGDGTFASGFSMTGTGSGSVAIVAGDFNGDGVLDLAISDDCFSSSGSCNGASILLGVGDGTFTFTSSPTAGGISFATADFNGDGNLDLAVATANGFEIFLGDGSGNFTLKSTLDTGLNLRNVGVADFNGDGKLDVADFVHCTTNQCVSGEVNVWTGNGDGTFTYSSTVASGPFTWFGVVSDFNADGQLDLADVSGCTEVTCSNGETTFELGNGDATFTRISAYPSGPDISATGTSAVVGDFNGDGRLDVATISQCGDKNCDSYNGVASILLQNSALTVSPSSIQFGTQTVQTVSAPQTVTLTNNSNASIALTSIVASGDFRQTNSCGTSIAANSTCTVKVNFAPTAKGVRTGVLAITTNATPTNPTVSLSGTGTVVGLSPPKLLFGNQKVGTTSAPLAITLVNKANGSLAISGISIVGMNARDFSQTNNCGTSLGSKQSCTVNVTFTPAAKGARSAVVNVVDNGGGSPQSVTVDGNGT
jgi:hypothetical protein